MSSSGKKTGLTSGEGGACQYCRIVVPLSFIDVDGPSLRSDAFYRRGPEDGIYLLESNENAASVFV